MLVVTAPVFVSATVAACGTHAAFESKRLSASGRDANCRQRTSRRLQEPAYLADKELQLLVVTAPVFVSATVAACG
ncbi:MAG: hypothetical protein O7C59_07040, partial [Rickettsia endosymbiont of Ixodes persulcatus]|nr:hypothetical protein [Rickettsia endosymbiont of Ixodes persulcatus]